MTDIKALSEAIALHHEARPTVTPPMPRSSEGWWVWTFSGGWTPANCTTPYNTMRLLKELQSKGVITIGRQEPGTHELWFVGVRTRPFEFAKELALAIAIAWCRANNVEVKGA